MVGTVDDENRNVMVIKKYEDNLQDNTKKKKDDSTLLKFHLIP